MKLWMAPAGQHIEPGTMSDAGTLAKLHAKSFYRGWQVSEFSSFLGDPKRTPTYVVADAKRRVSGFAMLRLAADEAELLTIVVDRKWRGKGIGNALLKACFDDLLMQPARKMFLEVEANNKAAIALYNRLGFAEIGQREGYYLQQGGEAATALVMRCALD